MKVFLYLKAHIKTSIIRERLLILFFSAFIIHAYPQSYDFRNFSSNDGLAQSYIYSIMQDVHGYLWIGTEDGLSRYNGIIFENYTTADSLANNFITCSIDNGEKLWFGHINGQLSYYDGDKFHKVNIPESAGSPITDFTKSPDGQILASTNSDGILEIGKVPVVDKRYIFKDQTIILEIESLENDELLVGTNSGLLYCRLKETGEIEIIRSVTDIPESKITCIQTMRDKSGFVIATENDGIFKLTQENNQFKVNKIIGDQDFELTGIQDIYEDSRSNLWLGSIGSGLVKISFSIPGRIARIDYYNKTNGFISDDIKTIYEDLEGDIWCGSYGQGLTLITPKTFSLDKLDNPIYGNKIFSICFTTKYNWIGTENGLVKMDHLAGKIVKFYGKEMGLPGDTVTAIYSSDGKELWIGTGRNGIYRMKTESEKINKYFLKDGTLENSVTSITGKDEQVWIGTKKGLYNVNLLTDKLTEYSIDQGGLPHNFINCLFNDRAGRLWVGTTSSILVSILDGKVFKVPLNSSSGILAIAEDNDSRLWVGSNGNGIFMIDSDSIARLTVNEGLLANYCYSIICDDNKNIWVGHKDGLSRIRTTDFSVNVEQDIKGMTENYQFYPNAASKDEKGKIWFGSDKGLVSYDPSMDYQILHPPVLGITSLKINDEEKIITDTIVLSPGNYKIRFDFLGISLREPEHVSYQYKLEGYEEWSEITKNTSITYYRLTEGDYTFILKAFTGGANVSEDQLVINIFIKKPVWKKWWFYPVDVLLLGSLVFIYIRRREYIFRVEQHKLEEKVRERTIEIQKQKDEIELQRDLIDEKNTEITSSIRYASHIQNALLPPMELLDKLLPDSFIFARPKDIVSGDFYWLAEKDNKIVFSVADCTGHGVPGAFMSLLGITILNEIVNINGITQSDSIITRLRERVIHSLQHNRKDASPSDGMDIALCVLDRHNSKIQFAGGLINLVFIHEGKLEIVRANRFSVCASNNPLVDFTLKEVDYRKGDVLYLFTDGYQDQFGGHHNKKFLRQHLYQMLLEIHQLPMLKQKEILANKLNEWIGDNIQTDDVTVMGMRL